MLSDDKAESASNTPSEGEASVASSSTAVEQEQDDGELEEPDVALLRELVKDWSVYHAVLVESHSGDEEREEGVSTDTCGRKYVGGT